MSLIYIFSVEKAGTRASTANLFIDVDIVSQTCALRTDRSSCCCFLDQPANTNKTPDQTTAVRCATAPRFNRNRWLLRSPTASPATRNFIAVMCATRRARVDKTRSHARTHARAHKHRKLTCAVANVARAYSQCDGDAQQRPAKRYER